jgi:hypothetical protein
VECRRSRRLSRARPWRSRLLEEIASGHVGSGGGRGWEGHNQLVGISRSPSERGCKAATRNIYQYSVWASQA